MTSPTTDDGSEDFVEALFHQALALPVGKRAKWVNDACGGDALLREEVLELLEAHGGAPSAFDDPAWGLSEELPAIEPEASLTGTAVGPYRIVSVLGEGGMGTVYLADQEEPLRRRVALKVIKAGMDTREVVARFDAERRALASLNHGSIASVYDAGTTERGRPYFVMEYVDGQRITDFCDSERLGISERVRLVARVCEAVQHAHAQGIVHRDLKPSNVLVTRVDGEPVPKVIDFGVAKATGNEVGHGTVFTRLGQLVGTPEYMSPEQALDAAGGIDARSDVYSLGVLLYRLLSGLLPLDLRGVRGASETAVREFFASAEVPLASVRFGRLRRSADRIASQRRSTPKHLVRSLRGPLDWILARALEHERTRRYATASDFAADLRRFLIGEPLLARRPSIAHRMQRSVRRHRRGVAVGAVCVSAFALSGVLWNELQGLRPQALAPSTASEATADRAATSELERPPLMGGQVMFITPDGITLSRGDLVHLVEHETLGDAVVPMYIASHAKNGAAAVAVVDGLVVGNSLVDGRVGSGDLGFATVDGFVTAVKIAGEVNSGDWLTYDPAMGCARAIDEGEHATPIGFAQTDAQPGADTVAAMLRRVPQVANAAPTYLTASEKSTAGPQVLVRGTSRLPDAEHLAFDGRRSSTSHDDALAGHSSNATSQGFGIASGAHVVESGPQELHVPQHAVPPNSSGGGGGSNPSDPGIVDPRAPGTGPEVPSYSFLNDNVTADSMHKPGHNKKPKGGNSDDGPNSGGPSGVVDDALLGADKPDVHMATGLVVSDSWQDVDYDGFPDVLLYGPGAATKLMRNVGGTTLHDITYASGLSNVTDAVEVWWRDVNDDALVDLIIRRGNGSVMMWRGLGRSSFLNTTERAGLTVIDHVVEMSWVDFDTDGFPDLRYVTAQGELAIAKNDRAGGFDVIVLKEPDGAKDGSSSGDDAPMPIGDDESDADDADEATEAPLKPTVQG